MSWPRHLVLRSSRARTRQQKLRSKLINMLTKRKRILSFRIRKKLERGQDLLESELAYVLRPPRGEHKDYTLSKTKHGLLHAVKILRLEKRSEKSPIVMFRSTTLTGLKHTNGYTTPNMFIPSANLMKDRITRRSNNDTSYIRTSMADIPLQELRPMLGQHLLWRDRIQDELLSWTISYVFATVHLYLRHLKGQDIGCVSMINRTRAFHPEDWDVEQLVSQVKNPAKFHSANDLCDYTGVYHDHEWPCQRDLPSLHPRKTNHEYITHGVVEYPENDRLQQATWDDLVAAGIFELVPELKVPSSSRAAGLYTVLRYIRTTNYNRVRRTTDRDLEVAQEIAWLHTRSQPGEDREQSRPNLWILLYTLTFHKRAAGDELLQKLIYRLGYTRQDLDENLYAGFGKFPSNLPEMESLYHLASDVQTVVGNQPLSPLMLTSTYSRSRLPDNIRGRDDADYEELYHPRLTEASTDGYKCERKCGLRCDCSIWIKIRKRKQVEEVEDDEGDEDDRDDEEEEKPHQSAATDTSTYDDHAGASVLTESNSLEGPARQTQGSPCAQEHRIMLLTYKCPIGTY